MKINEEKIYLCALGHIFGFEPRISLALVNHFGSATEVFNAGTSEIDKILGAYSKHRGKVTEKAARLAYEELERLSAKGVSFIGWNEEGYPELLKECEDAPIGIYIRSETPANELLNNKRSIGIVGTRDISLYGQEWCEKLTVALSTCREKPVIISGLAIGTDICTHKTALNNGLPTIGIMATGPEQIYPARHTSIAEKMTETPGCGLITDYPPGTKPLAINFLRRNRIIAGLCDSLILIESKAKGGGMNTARLAFSYDRDVYALPGRVDDIRSQGCNILIREQIAEPIIDIESLIKELQLERPHNIKEDYYKHNNELILRTFKNKIDENNIDQMCALLLEIRKERGITIEELCTKTGMDYGTTSRLVSILETESFINTDLLQRCSINVKKV